MFAAVGAWWPRQRSVGAASPPGPRTRERRLAIEHRDLVLWRASRRPPEPRCVAAREAVQCPILDNGRDPAEHRPGSSARAPAIGHDVDPLHASSLPLCSDPGETSSTIEAIAIDGSLLEEPHRCLTYRGRRGPIVLGPCTYHGTQQHVLATVDDDSIVLSLQDLALTVSRSFRPPSCSLRTRFSSTR